MSLKFVKTGCISALAIVLCGTALAEDVAPASELAWEQEQDRIWTVDGSDAGKKADFYNFVRIITSSGGNGPIVQLGCRASSRGDNALSAGIQLDPNNAYDEHPKRNLRLLSMSGVLTIGDERTSERFQYHPDSSKLIPFNRSVPRRLFNAVVLGDTVTLKARNKTYNLEIPGKDPVFKAFAKICPVTNGGKFDQSIFDRVQARIQE